MAVGFNVTSPWLWVGVALASALVLVVALWRNHRINRRQEDFLQALQKSEDEWHAEMRERRSQSHAENRQLIAQIESILATGERSHSMVMMGLLFAEIRNDIDATKTELRGELRDLRYEIRRYRSF